MRASATVAPSAPGYATYLCAAHADQRRALAELLAQQIATLPVERVYFAFEPQRPAADTTVTRVPRLSLPLAGRHPFEVNVGDGADVLRLEPREALFMLPGSWRRALFDETRTHTAIVFERDYVWFFAQHCAPAPPTQPQLWYHTAQPIVPEGLDLIHALSGMARSGRNLDVAPALVRSLVQIAHAQLADSAAAPCDAGEAMWRGMCAYIRDRYRHALDRESIAAAFDVHPNHVSRLFRRHGGEASTAPSCAPAWSRRRGCCAPPTARSRRLRSAAASATTIISATRFAASSAWRRGSIASASRGAVCRVGHGEERSDEAITLACHARRCRARNDQPAKRPTIRA